MLVFLLTLSMNGSDSGVCLLRLICTSRGDITTIKVRDNKYLDKCDGFHMRERDLGHIFYTGFGKNRNKISHLC